jgi:hypothetical protein
MDAEAIEGSKGEIQEVALRQLGSEVDAEALPEPGTAGQVWAKWRAARDEGEVAVEAKDVLQRHLPHGVFHHVDPGAEAHATVGGGDANRGREIARSCTRGRGHEADENASRQLEPPHPHHPV